jgi:hypothetical protein
MELVAVPFTDVGEDAVQGDSAFAPDDDSKLVATEDSTFESLLAAWREQGLASGDLAGDEEEEDGPTGFWLLTREHLKIACIPMDNDCGNDSQWYSLVRSAKSICERMAVKTVRKP